MTNGRVELFNLWVFSSSKRIQRWLDMKYLTFASRSLSSKRTANSRLWTEQGFMSSHSFHKPLLSLWVWFQHRNMGIRNTRGRSHRKATGLISDKPVVTSNLPPTSLSLTTLFKPWSPPHPEGTGIGRPEGVMDARWKGLVENKAPHHGFEMWK